MVTVTQESLAARIAELEAGPRSLKEDFALQAHRMLLPHAPANCGHKEAINIFNPSSPTNITVVCMKCGKELGNG